LDEKPHLPSIWQRGGLRQGRSPHRDRARSIVNSSLLRLLVTFEAEARQAGARMLTALPFMNASPPTTPPVSSKPGRALPIVLAVALFMENMDSTVIATSLPQIAADLDTSPVTLKLALTAYLVSLAIFIPISGWMADRYGAKTVFRAAMAVFVVGSVCCAFSGSLGAFVLSRFLQGMGGAMMTPIARLVLVRATPKAMLVTTMAWLTMPGLIGPLMGPPLGGFITTFFSWHWIFIINVPIGIAGIIAAGRVMPEIPPEGRKRLDVTGFLLAGVAAAGVVFGLSVISLPALPPAVGVVTTAVGLAAALLYVRHALRTPDPLLDVRLFRLPVFRTAIAGSVFFRIGSGAVPFLLPLMFQLAFGLSAFESGLMTLASALGALSMKMMAAGVLRRVGFRTVTALTAGVGGIMIMANALFTATTPYLVVFLVLLLAGFLRSLFFTSVNALVFDDVENHQASQATAIGAALQQISVALGVAFAGGTLEAIGAITGRGIDHGAFVAAFLIVGFVASLSAIFFMRLPRDAGSVLSGHAARMKAENRPELRE
jgi:EmrB/QacA subfamily drug resistance transporter